MTVKPNSQNARILEVLADGEPHTTAEIHRRAGTSRLNSRIAELRKAGYPIGPCERVPGATGTEAYAYRLLADVPARIVETTAAVVADERGQLTLTQIEADVERYGHVAAWR